MSELQYGHDDARDYEPYFSRHLMAMTAEDLHSKGEIACELAYRDARIAELEAACEKAEYELDWHSDELRQLEAEEQLFHNTFDAQQMIIEELRAENQRLRDAAQAVVDSATPHYDRWVNGVTRICINRLAALLGGGE